MNANVQKLFILLLKKNLTEVFLITFLEPILTQLNSKYNHDLLEDILDEIAKDLLDKWLNNKISLLNLNISNKNFDDLIKTYSNQIGIEFLQELDTLVKKVITEVESLLDKALVIGGCAGTQYGCCPNGRQSKTDASGNNCKCSPISITPIQQPYSDIIPSYKIGSDGYPKSLFNEFRRNSYELLYSLYVSYQNTCTPKYLIGQYGNCYKGGTPCPTVPDADIIGPSQIFIMRHGEKTSGDWNINQNGIYRASQLVNWVNDLCCQGSPISYIVTYNPCALTTADASMRGQQTISFASTMLNIPTYTFSQANNKNDGSPGGPEETINRIFDASNNIFQGKNILICWEHGNIQKIVESIIVKKLKVDPSFYAQYQTSDNTIESAANNYWKIQNPCLNGSYLNNSLSATQPPDKEYEIQAESAIYKPYWNTLTYDLFYLFNNAFYFTVSQHPILTANANCNLNICMLLQGTGCVSSNVYGTEESCLIPDESDIIPVTN